MFLYQYFPDAQRVQLDLLIEKYNFTENAINEIKEKWKYDPSTGYYVKPGGVYDTFTVPSNPQESG